jgi:uncharacterized membrane protein
MRGLGANYAVMVLKQHCGWAMWPSNVTLPSGERYGCLLQSIIMHCLSLCVSLCVYVLHMYWLGQVLSGVQPEPRPRHCQVRSE